MKILVTATLIIILGLVAWREMKRDEDATFSATLREDRVYVYNFTSGMAPAMPDDTSNSSAFDEIMYLIGRSELVGSGSTPDRVRDGALRWMVPSGDEITLTSKRCDDGVRCVSLIAVKPYHQEFINTSPIVRSEPVKADRRDQASSRESISSPVAPVEDATERKEKHRAALQSNRQSLTGDWLRPWEEEKLAALTRCAILFDSLQLRDVCMRNEINGYRQMQGNFGLPAEMVDDAKARCGKVFDSFQLQAVCMGNEKRGYDNLRRY